MGVSGDRPVSGTMADGSPGGVTPGAGKVVLLLAQGLTAAATAEALERTPTLSDWASFGEGGLIFEQTGGSLTRRSRRS